jgi:hypothetical protein
VRFIAAPADFGGGVTARLGVQFQRRHALVVTERRGQT